MDLIKNKMYAKKPWTPGVLILLGLMLLFASCGSAQDESSGKNLDPIGDELIGKWHCGNTTNEYNLYSKDLGDLEFKNDGTFLSSNASFIRQYTSYYSGVPVVISESGRASGAAGKVGMTKERKIVFHSVTVKEFSQTKDLPADNVTTWLLDKLSADGASSFVKEREYVYELKNNMLIFKAANNYQDKKLFDGMNGDNDMYYKKQ